tara:strand:- start:13650 stop:14006 length:357 start_codon:yes stop_codon:yes gene_type:complete
METLTLAKGRGNDIPRYRRFRLANPQAREKHIALLLKRRFFPLLDNTDVVNLSNINVIKHALLGTVAEDNSDTERANFHWGMCKMILDEEKDAFRGMAKPKVNLDPTGQTGHSIRNIL